ncbi:MAG: serine/threonine-protein kinase [Anaerolineae bacterium]
MTSPRILPIMEGGHIPLAIGSVAKVELVELLGMGGFGSAWRVVDCASGTPYVLKIIQLKTTDGTTVDRVRVEAGVRLRSDHVVPACGFDEWDPHTFLILFEYVPGLSLDKRIDAGDLSPEAKREIFRQILLGVADVHAAGMVHRDLKPDNVLVGDDGRVRLIDFGISKFAGSDLTRTGDILGTFPYMAPELIMIGAKVADARSDIYSLGHILYELAMGQHFWKRRGWSELADFVPYLVASPPPVEGIDLSDFHCDFFRNADRVLSRMVKIDPSERYSSVSEVLGDLFPEGAVASGTRAGSASSPPAGEAGRMSAATGGELAHHGSADVDLRLLDNVYELGGRGNRRQASVPLGRVAVVARKDVAEHPTLFGVYLAGETVSVDWWRRGAQCSVIEVSEYPGPFQITTLQPLIFLSSSERDAASLTVRGSLRLSDPIKLLAREAAWDTDAGRERLTAAVRTAFDDRLLARLRSDLSPWIEPRLQRVVEEVAKGLDAELRVFGLGLAGQVLAQRDFPPALSDVVLELAEAEQRLIEDDGPLLEGLGLGLTEGAEIQSVSSHLGHGAGLFLAGRRRATDDAASRFTSHLASSAMGAPTAAALLEELRRGGHSGWEIEFTHHVVLAAFKHCRLGPGEWAIG